MKTQNNKPIHEIRIGAIKAAIWANELPHGTRHNVTLARLFKDGEQWKQSVSFSRDDLLIVLKAADAAFDWIVANQKKEPAEE